MHPNEGTITTFYEALGLGDAETMSTVYASDATFTDPVFDLRGAEIGDMWRMFCEAGSDLRVGFSEVTADDRAGRARWEAFYTFPPTNRSVHNEILASFEFADGLIVAHRDEFDLWAWARQAVGLPGRLVGWTPWMRNRIRRQAADQLRRFRQRLPPADPAPSGPD